MKKLLNGVLAVTAAVLFAGCASTGGASKKPAEPFKITKDSGVVGYYTFDEDIKDNVVSDHSGNSLDADTAALDGSVTVEGKEGKALSFNGTDEYLSIDSSLLDGEGVTIAGWLKPTAWKDWARVFDIGDTKEDAWCGMDWNTKMLRFDVIGAKGSISVLSPLPAPGAWTHLAATFGNGKAALYVNGKLAQEIPCANTIADLKANVQGIYIGRSNWADPLYNGAMDDVLVANRVFSAAEIASVYAGVVAQ